MSTKSKQAEAKEAQGYTTAANNCGNCANMTSERALPAWIVRENEERSRVGMRPHSVEIFGVEKNLRCGIGGFAINKTATCAKHMPKSAGEKE